MKGDDLLLDVERRGNWGSFVVVVLVIVATAIIARRLPRPAFATATAAGGLPKPPPWIFYWMWSAARPGGRQGDIHDSAPRRRRASRRGRRRSELSPTGRLAGLLCTCGTLPPV